MESNSAVHLMDMGRCPIPRVLDEIATDVPPELDNAQCDEVTAMHAQISNAMFDMMCNVGIVVI